MDIVDTSGDCVGLCVCVRFIKASEDITHRQYLLDQLLTGIILFDINGCR